VDQLDNDMELARRAEAKCTGADIHMVRNTTCVLGGFVLLARQEPKKYTACRKKLRKALNLYLTGTPIRKARQLAGL